ncbi:MAG: flavin reductase family protein [Gemmataceae bacterium]
MPDNDALAAALGRVPSGLFILTARQDESEAAMLASWVQQCSFDPPQVTVGVQRGRPAYALLPDGATCVLNVVAEGQTTMLKHFGRGFAPGEPAFAGIAVERTADGVAILTDALAHLECRVVGRASGGDHELLIARVEAGSLHSDGKPWVHLRKNGLGY